MSVLPSIANKRYFYDVRQYALITRPDGALLALKLPKHCGKAAGLWTLPGGKLEPTDAPTGGLLREIKEETGLIPKVATLFTSARWKTESSEKLGLFYHVALPENPKKILLSEEHIKAKWVTPSTLKNHTFYRTEIEAVVAQFFKP